MVPAHGTSAHDERFFRRALSQARWPGRVLHGGLVGGGATDQLFERLAGLVRRIRSRQASRLAQDRVINRQRRSRAHRIGEHHYDLGNDLFTAMLGRTMAYSCAYWDRASSLDEAQEAKFDLVCRKLGLEAGQSVLDIGCG
jgi:cyclopropane-fatty-acyl-phospholipid synthase